MYTNEINNKTDHLKDISFTLVVIDHMYFYIISIFCNVLFGIEEPCGNFFCQWY